MGLFRQGRQVEDGAREVATGSAVAHPATPISNGDKSAEIVSTVAGHALVLVSQNQGPFVFAGFVDADHISATVIDPTVVLNTGDSCVPNSFSVRQPQNPSNRCASSPLRGLVRSTSSVTTLTPSLTSMMHTPKARMLLSRTSTYSRAIDPNCGSSHSGGDSGVPSLVQYVTDLHNVALQHPELALIVFDCKPDTNTPDLGLTLLTAIRTHLTFDIRLTSSFPSRASTGSPCSTISAVCWSLARG